MEGQQPDQNATNEAVKPDVQNPEQLPENQNQQGESQKEDPLAGPDEPQPQENLATSHAPQSPSSTEGLQSNQELKKEEPKAEAAPSGDFTAANAEKELGEEEDDEDNDL